VNPLRAVGQLMHWEPKRGIGPTFVGTCFAFRTGEHFITAAHCASSLQAHQLAIRTPLGGLIKSALSLEKHPDADLAIVRVPSIHAEGDVVEPFALIVGNWSLGEDFYAYGYPVDVMSAAPTQPVERLFKGHFQRFVQYKSEFGYSYLAAELSFPSPAGLSGGPLFRPAAPSVVLGLAAENLRSRSVLEELEERRDDTGRIEQRYSRLIEYGVAVMLSPLLPWIDERIPPRAAPTST
jgi:hypothetical protein